MCKIPSFCLEPGLLVLVTLQQPQCSRPRPSGFRPSAFTAREKRGAGGGGAGAGAEGGLKGPPLPGGGLVPVRPGARHLGPCALAIPKLGLPLAPHQAHAVDRGTRPGSEYL